MNWAIQTKELTKVFPSQRGWRGLFSRGTDDTEAVSSVNLNIKQGELFGLLGPNGAGKTTLVKMLCTLISPTSGDASVLGFNLNQTQQIKSNIGLITNDERSFFWRLSGKQNLEFFAALHGIPASIRDDRIQSVMQLVDLLSISDNRFQTYSTGMRQRLAIARALVHQPQVLFLDEPTRGLDRPSTHRIHELLKKTLVEDLGITVFLTTHNLEEAAELCDRIGIIHQGKLRAVGTLDDLQNDLEIGHNYRVRARFANSEAIHNLHSQLPEAHITEYADVQAEIQFHDNQLKPEIDSVLMQVKQVGGSILNIESENKSIEQIFSQLTVTTDTRARGVKSETIQIQPAVRKSDEKHPPDAGQFSLKTVSTNIQITWAFLKRDFMIESSYRFSFIVQIISVLLSTGIFYFLSLLFGDAAIPYISDFNGDYFPFVLIGIAFSGYFGVGLTSFSTSIREAQTAGTLEAMLSTPTNISVIILSSSLWAYALTTFRVFLYLIIGAGFLGVNLRMDNLPFAILVLLLSVISFTSLGIIAASFIMVIKRGEPITWMANSLTNLLGGIYFPVEILPIWLQWIAYLIPVTYALRAIRSALIADATSPIVFSDLLILFVFCVILLPVSLLSFRFAVNRARLDGSLTHY